MSPGAGPDATRSHAPLAQRARDDRSRWTCAEREQPLVAPAESRPRRRYPPERWRRRTAIPAASQAGSRGRVVAGELELERLGQGADLFRRSTGTSPQHGQLARDPAVDQSLRRGTFPASATARSRSPPRYAASPRTTWSGTIFWGLSPRTSATDSSSGGQASGSPRSIGRHRGPSAPRRGSVVRRDAEERPRHPRRSHPNGPRSSEAAARQPSRYRRLLSRSRSVE